MKQLSRDEVESKIPAQFKLLYEFHGRIHPIDAIAEFPDFGIAKIRIDLAEEIIWAIRYFRSQSGLFCLDVYLAEEFFDLASLRNVLREHLDAFLDLSCLYNGIPYFSEISHCITPKGEKVLLNTYSPSIAKLNQFYNKRVAKEILTRHRCFPFLTLALRDFRRAIIDASETHALIFRSIESIRNYYAEINGLNTENKRDQQKSWVILRETLGYSRDSFKFLETKAIARRHGILSMATSDELEECRAFAWQFFISFLEKTFGPDCIVP